MRSPCAVLLSSLSVVTLLLLIPRDFCAQIIGGKEVIPHSRPYMVLIKIDRKQICAGALVDKNWVLTAAHCFVNNKSHVILGAHVRNKTEPGKQIRLIKRGIVYPCYDPRTHEGDLQLLQLNKQATIRKNINLLPLPKRGEDVKPGTACRVAGWGSTANKGPMSNILREVNVTVIDRTICNDQKHYNSNPVVGLNMICAGSLKGGKDSCNGDSGSPLICDGTFKGVTAFGMEGKCGTPQGPGVYTLLSKKHLVWIFKTMAGAV